ncbi:hypothetical protein [Tsuneonella sp. HG222]
MSDQFSETTDWQGAAWAFAVWAAHFSALWGASSVFPNSPVARMLAMAATLVAIAALAVLWRRRRSAKNMPKAAIGFAAVAIVFGALPAVVG